MTKHIFIQRIKVETRWLINRLSSLFSDLPFPHTFCRNYLIPYYTHTHIYIYINFFLTYIYIYIFIHYIYIYKSISVHSKYIYINIFLSPLHIYIFQYIQLYIYIYIYIYILIHGQTVSLYHIFFVWIDMQDASSWDGNQPNFTLDLVSNSSAISVTYICLGIITDTY